MKPSAGNGRGLADKIQHEQMSVTDIVEQVLAEDRRARNSDLWLILRVWRTVQGIKIYVPYDRLDDLIAPASITRARRTVQNERCEYLPTDPQVLRRRRFKEEALHELFAKNPSLRRQYFGLK